MSHQYITCPLNKQASEEQADALAQAVEQFLHPLLVCLDLVLDRRKVAYVRASRDRDHRASQSQYRLVALRIGRRVALSRSRASGNQAVE
jgi:hypothetical protein